MFESGKIIPLYFPPICMYMTKYESGQVYQWFVLRKIYHVHLVSSLSRKLLLSTPLQHTPPHQLTQETFSRLQYFFSSPVDRVSFITLTPSSPSTFSKQQLLLCSVSSGSSAVMCKREQLLFISTYCINSPNTIPCFLFVFVHCFVCFHTSFYQSSPQIIFACTVPKPFFPYLVNQHFFTLKLSLAFILFHDFPFGQCLQFVKNISISDSIF